MGSGRYAYAGIVAAVLSLVLAAIALPHATGGGSGVAGRVEGYVESVLVADFQRSAAIGYAALQPSYPLESLLADIARLYTRTIYVGGGSGSYTVSGVAVGGVPAGIRPEGSPLTVPAGSMFMFCSPKGNLLAVGRTAYNFTIHVVEEPGGRTVIYTVSRQPNISRLMESSTSYSVRGSVAIISERTVFKLRAVTSETLVGLAIDSSSGRLLYYKLVNTMATQAGSSRSTINITAAGPGPVRVSYNITRPGGAIANSTLVSQVYWNTVLALSSKIPGMVSVEARRVGRLQGKPLYHVTVKVRGSLSFSGFTLNVDALLEGDYVKLGSILYPVKGKLESFNAILAGPSKTCRITLQKPATLEANITITGNPYSG